MEWGINLAKHMMLLPFVVAALMSSCYSAHNVAVANVNPKIWGNGEWVVAEYDNEDTVAFYDMSVLLRYGADFAHTKLNVRVMTTTPDSLSVCEDILLPIDKVKKKNISDYTEVEVLYRNKVILSQRGRYKFGFALAKDVGSVKGVSGVGIVLTPAER